MREPIEQQITFQQLIAEMKANLLQDVATARAWLDQSDHPDCVFIKNSSSVVIASNAAYVEFFTSGQNPIGRNSADFLDLSTRSASKLSDALVLGAARELEFAHEGRCSDGATYELRSYKLNLRELGEPGWAIAGVTRRVARLNERCRWITLSEEGRYDTFRQLSENDRWICQQVALGRSSAEIGEDLNLTRRAIEMRKRKVLDALGLESTAQLIRLMVRLNDGGYTDLGL